MPASTPPKAAPRRTPISAFNAKLCQLTGTLLDSRYKVLGSLASDPQLRRYLAEDLLSGGAVELWLCPSASAQEHEQRLNLARSLPNVSHPNLVDVLGVGKTSAGVPYLVSEALLGETLAQALSRRSELTLELALLIARQAAGGVAALHHAGLTHGGLRPSRILLLGQGADTFGIKLMDHGALRAFSESELSPQALGEEAVYLAPEQWLDAVSDARSDVYSLGMLLGRALLGRTPYARGSVHGGAQGSSSELVRWTFNAPVAVSRAHTDADARLDAVILNATRKRPENRYADAIELLADLSAIVGVSNNEVIVRPLLASPDAFEPRTERGRAVARGDTPA